MLTAVRGASAITFTVGVLLLAAACGSSPQTPNADSTTPATVTGAATTSSPSGTPTATAGTTSTPGTSTATATRTPAPAAPIPTSLVGHVVSRIPTSRKVVALTFDAGANGDGVNSILATLAKEKVAATFYLTGNFVNAFPTLAVRMSAAGRLGNHSTSHPHLPTLTDAQVRTQVTSAQATILRVTGEDPRPLFRFPFGDSGPRDLRLVNDLGYIAVGWTVDTLGWQGTSGGRSVNSVVQRVLAAATPGEIVLMHVGSNPTDHSTLDADALPRVISGLRAAGYSFVTLDALGAG
jgi:peptidoglycan/xylan/chitin deacetylase (PgdA/CDA1 family)